LSEAFHELDNSVSEPASYSLTMMRGSCTSLQEPAQISRAKGSELKFIQDFSPDEHGGIEKASQWNKRRRVFFRKNGRAR